MKIIIGNQKNYLGKKETLDFIEKKVCVFNGNVRSHLHLGFEDGVEVGGLHGVETFVVKADPYDLSRIHARGE